MRFPWFSACIVLALMAKGFGDSLEEDEESFWDMAKELWLTGTIELFGYYCDFKRVPRLMSQKLYFKAWIKCVGWVPYTGRAVHHNKYRAIDLATLDLIKQILYNGLISEKEVMEWVKTLL